MGLELGGNLCHLFRLPRHNHDGGGRVGIRVGSVGLPCLHALHHLHFGLGCFWEEFGHQEDLCQGASTDLSGIYKSL